MFWQLTQSTLLTSLWPSNSGAPKAGKNKLLNSWSRLSW